MMGNTRHTGTPDPQEQELDADIHTIRAEIKALQHRKRILTTTLLSSKPLQPLLSQKTTTSSTLSTLKEDLSPLASAADAHNTANNHRIAFGATAFPFKDPSPNTAFPNLLGIRIDVCARDGRFVKPYYVLLRREHAGNGRGNGKSKDGRASVRLCVHRHTVPAFIAIKRLEGVYLSSSGSGSGRRREESDGEDESESESEDVPMKGGKGKRQRQDLRGFVRELRREVVAWHLRCDAVAFLREKLGLARSDTESDVDEEERSLSSPKNELGIIELEATAIEARYVRMEWEDGRLGQFKLTNSGTVERAVFMNDRGRDKVFEDAVIGGGGRIESLVDRLTRLSNESE